MSPFRVRGAVCRGVVFAVLAAPLSGFGATSGAVGEVWVSDLAAPDVLQTHVVETSSELSSSARMTYEIGFSTREQIDIGFIFDSITLSLARLNGDGAANLATGDVFGLTPGSISGGVISVQPVTPRISLLDGAATTFAYTVEVELPPALVGAELRNTFSFFNNGDEVPSRAYAVVVPEPPASAFVVITGIGILLWRWQRRTHA